MATVRKRVRVAAGGAEKTSWVADYFDQHGKRHLKTFATKKAADTWLVDTRGEVKNGTHTPERNSVTVWQAAELWLERGKVENLERATLRGYAIFVDLHIDPTLGPVKLAQLSTTMLEGWKDRLITGSEHRAPITRALARKVLATLKAILSDAQCRGLVGQNPALPVKIATKSREVEKLEAGINIPSKEQIQRLLATATGRHRAFLIVAVFTGLRASELRGLPWSAVDFEARTITVRQRADEWGVIGAPISKAGRRAIPMSPVVFNTLREWKLACPKGDLDLVFPNTLGKVQPLSNFEKRTWRPLQVKAGLVDTAGAPLLNFHTLRHFFASWAIERGFTPKKLQALLGHSSISMTFDRYGHLFPSTEDDHAKFASGEIGLVA
jgi:integrase